MFLIICAVIFVLGIAFTLSGVGVKNAHKVSDADQELKHNFNVDGTAMLGAFDMNGNIYGCTSSDSDEE